MTVKVRQLQAGTREQVCGITCTIWFGRQNQGYKNKMKCKQKTSTSALVSDDVALARLLQFT